MAKIKFKRRKKLMRLYEVWFNNNKRNFDRISATSKADAEKKMKKYYPKHKVSGSRLIG